MILNRKTTAVRGGALAGGAPPLSPRFARLVRESWWLIVVSKRSACFWKRVIRSGPWTPSASAGQLSTSVVVISCPPCARPVINTGFRFARAAYTAAV